MKIKRNFKEEINKRIKIRIGDFSSQTSFLISRQWDKPSTFRSSDSNSFFLPSVYFCTSLRFTVQWREPTTTYFLVNHCVAQQVVQTSKPWALKRSTQRSYLVRSYRWYLLFFFSLNRRSEEEQRPKNKPF